MELDLEAAGGEDEEEHLTEGELRRGLDAFRPSGSEAEDAQPAISPERRTDAG